MPGAATARAVVLVAGGCLLAGCGSAANPYALPKYDPQATAAAAAGPPSATASPAGPAGSARSARQILGVKRAATPPPEVKYRPADPWGEGAWVSRGKIDAGTSQARAAVDAMTKYMSVRVQLSNTWQVDEQALAAVASGEAVTSAQARAERQRKRDWRSIGRVVVNVSSVKLDGSHASVTGCYFDGTSEVDQNGGVVIGPPGGVRITMELQRTGGVWRVVNWPDGAVPVCDDWGA